MRLIADRNQALASRSSSRRASLSHCFAPGTPESYIQNVTAQSRAVGTHFRINEAPGHWEFTATDGSGIERGDPITLTWSIVPDGTGVPGLGGAANSGSDLRARLNELYGNEATWLPLFQQAFDRWQALTGITYVYEPNDDGAAFSSFSVGGDATPGILGTRGDVRIGGRALDGDFGTLAFNFGAPNGEMILDTDDSAFDNKDNNSRLFRNTVAHEHGHGLGLQHTCPENKTKIMEPTVPADFDGPQHDDILGAQRQHGDPREDNDSFAKATDLGSLTDGTYTANTILGGDLLSIDGDDDVDIFQFSLPVAGKNASVTLRPFGQSYLEAAQNPDGTCPPGVMVDSRTNQNLGIEIIGSDASTVLGSANLNPAGQNETLIDIPLAGGTGPFFVRVVGGAEDNVQMYEFDLVIGDGQTGTLHHFGFDPIASPQSVQQSFNVAINAEDIFNGPVASFNGSVTLSVAARETVLITEIDPGAVDRVEFGNVADRAIDVSGWQIIVYDGSSGAGPASTTTLPALSSVAAGSVFTLTENGSAPGALPSLSSGTEINWSHNASAISVLLLDDSGAVVDFATLDDSASITMPGAIPPDQWTGPGINATAGDTYQRTGSSDSNASEDWGSAPESMGSLNSNLTAPFPARDLDFSPKTSASFNNGAANVSLTFTEPGERVVIKAEDGSGNVGYSSPFDLELVDDISVELIAAPSSVRAGEAITYNATVRNAGPTDATMVTLTDTLPANTSFVSAASSQGSVSETGGVVTANLGTIVGGGAVTVTINLTSSTTGTLMNAVSATRAETDPYTPNNTASVNVAVVKGPDDVEEFNAFPGFKGSFSNNTVANDTGTQFEFLNFGSGGTTSSTGFGLDTTLSQNGRGLTVEASEGSGMRNAADISPGDYNQDSHMLAFWFRFSDNSGNGVSHSSSVITVYNQAAASNGEYAYNFQAGVDINGTQGVGMTLPRSSGSNTVYPFTSASPNIWHMAVVHYDSASDNATEDGLLRLWIDPPSGGAAPSLEFTSEENSLTSRKLGPFGHYGFGQVLFGADSLGPDVQIDSIGSWDGFGSPGSNDLQAGIDFLKSSIPNLAIAATSASKSEGDSGSTQFDFTITRTGPNAVDTTVNYAVTGSGSNPADAADFGGALPSGSVMFTMGETSKSVTINVTGDTDTEPNEEFNITLSVPAGGVVINTFSAGGTIQNDDQPAQFDFGDAPDPADSTAGQYPTLLANDGARHQIVANAPRLGVSIDAESDGLPSPTALGDDNDGSPGDEDGVAIPTLIAGSTIAIPVEVSVAGGKLDAWVDFNQDGIWGNPEERVANDLAVGVGVTMVMVSVPADAATGKTVARFRLSSAGGLSPTGTASDGEVEDHQALIINQMLPSADNIALPTADQAGDVTVLFLGTAGTVYQVQTSTDLSDWNTIATITADSNGVVFHQDTGVGAQPKRFYRLKEQ